MSSALGGLAVHCFGRGDPSDFPAPRPARTAAHDARRARPRDLQAAAEAVGAVHARRERRSWSPLSRSSSCWFWVSYGRMIDATSGRRAAAGAAHLRPPVRAQARARSVAGAARPAPQRRRLRRARRRRSAPGEFGVSNTTVTVMPRTRRARTSRESSAWTFARANAPVIARLDGRRRQAGRARVARSAAAGGAGPGRTTPVRPARQHPASGDRRGPHHRRSPVLRPSGRRSDRHPARVRHQRQRGPLVPGRRQHAHAADRQEHVPDAGEDARAASSRNSSWRSCSSRASPRTRSSSST